MKHKKKGSDAERELVKMFWDAGWAALRVAGSGSSHFPSPDVLAANAIRRIAMECKACKSKAKYLTKDEILDLKTFAKQFGAEAWIGVRFDIIKWFFLNVEDLSETGKHFSLTVELCRNKGLLFEEMISS